MEIHVRDASKIVEVWLTNSEKQDDQVRKQLQPLYREYKAKKYLVAVFLSGSQDLADNTSALLRYNRKRLAQMEVEQQKQKGMAMEM